jgi:hypothetical protein
MKVAEKRCGCDRPFLNGCLPATVGHGTPARHASCIMYIPRAAATVSVTKTDHDNNKRYRRGRLKA